MAGAETFVSERPSGGARGGRSRWEINQCGPSASFWQLWSTLSGPLLVGISESVRAVQAQPPQAASHPAPQKKAPETAPITTPPGPQATTKPQLIIKGSDFVGNG